MVNIVLRSVVQEETLINDTIEFLEPDLHIITKEGVTIRTNKFLIGQGSPILRSLLSNGVNAMSTPSFLFLPDVTAPAIIHFISVIKKGFTNGRGWGYPVINQVREVAELLGFENIPLLVFVEPQEVEELAQSAQQVLNEGMVGQAEKISGDSGNDMVSIEMDTEDNINEHDEHNQHDTEHHIAASINKKAHQDEHMQSGHILAELSQADHMQAKHCQDKHVRSNQPLSEHSQNEDEPSQSSVLNLCSFEPLNLNSVRMKTLVSKSPIKSNNMNRGEIEIYQFKSQEITEAITKVLKKDPDGSTATEDVPKFPCGKCRKPFSCAGTLLVHAEKHGEMKGKRKCTLCNFSGLRTDLLTHIRSKHTKEKLFQCSVCQKKFSNCKKKNSHESLHTQPKEKLFDCSVCHHKFSSRRAMNEHEKKHTLQACYRK